MPLSFPGGLWVPVFNGGFSSVSTATFTNLGLYRTLRVLIEGYLPSNNDTGLLIHTSSNNGSSYDAGATDYSYVVHTANSAGTRTSFASTGDTSMPCPMIDSGPGLGWCEMTFLGFNEAANLMVRGTGGYDGPNLFVANVMCQRKQATARNAFSLTPDSGGTFSIANLLIEGVQG